VGSVKDLEVLSKPRKKEMGIARFHFSDRYSVFDWGEMPDLIEGKGAALCIMGAYCFEKLEEKGIKTHYRGLVDPNGKLVKTDELREPVNVMEINFVNVYRPKPYVEDGELKYDYSIFTPSLTNFLIPLEIIYRNGLPEGSSVFKRLRKGLKPEDLGLDHYPKPGEKLEKPIFDVSTKLEEKDRYITWSEAQEIAGLTDEEIKEIKEKLLRVNDLITKVASRGNLENEDGKIELAFDPRRKLMIVDVVGTLDECRFTYQGLHVSKEIARRYYKTTRWYEDVENAKRKADAEGVEDWRSLCKSKPPKLDQRLKEIICNLYMAAANEFTGLNLFDAPSLVNILDEYKEYLSERNEP
jgi:phosphoribosylaminoimidazole-succinocarboxamide synthase